LVKGERLAKSGFQSNRSIEYDDGCVSSESRSFYRRFPLLFISQFACLSFAPGEKADTAIVNGIGCFGKIAQDFCLVFVGQTKGR
jgi:hypothetical protein